MWKCKALTPLLLQHQNTYFPKWGHYLCPEGWSSVGCYILQPTSHRISSHLFVLQNYKWDKSFVLTSLGPVQLLPSQPLAPPSFKLAQHNAQSSVGFLDSTGSLAFTLLISEWVIPFRKIITLKYCYTANTANTFNTFNTLNTFNTSNILNFNVGSSIHLEIFIS